MKISKSFLAGAALLFASTAATGAAFDKGLAQKREVSVKQLMRSMAPNTTIGSSHRTQHINEMNAWFNSPKGASRKAAEATVTPEATFGHYAYFADLDGPNGELWYYTISLYSKEVQYEFYTDEILQEYKFDIYDSNFKLIGTVHDKMRYEEDEVSVPGPLSGIDLLPTITKNYFNNDDKYEVVVSVAVNTTTPGYNRYRSVVYSLDGEKETVLINRDGKDVEVEVDKPINQYNTFIIDVLDASTDSEENYYMTFSDDIYNSKETAAISDDTGSSDYWENISTVGTSYVTYSKANEDGLLTKVFDRYLPYIQMQGDQQSIQPIFTFMREGTPYLLFPYYKEPYFNVMNDYYEDMTMREGNSLVIELYKLTPNGEELFAKTEIPAEKLQQDDVIGNYYAVGGLRYSRDISFDEDGKPLYTITRSNYLAGQDDASGFCYYVYDSQGNLKKTIFEGADSDLSLNSIPGFNDLHMFVAYDDLNGYVYNMVDLATGSDENTVKINYLLDTGMETEDILLFNMDRVAIGDSYKYVFEMKTPLVDEDDNTYMRIAWFDADGKFERIDNVNMGQQIQYAMSYMNGNALSPHLFNDDDTHEYMILVKRGISTLSSESHEEFMVAQPTNEDLTGGKTILHLVPDSGKGALNSIGLYPGALDTDTRLMVGYLNEDYSYTVDFYNLPLNTITNIDEVLANGTAPSAISFDGTSLKANGMEIKVFGATGTLVASGKGSLSVDTLPAGVYVATAGESVSKFVVK